MEETVLQALLMNDTYFKKAFVHISEDLFKQAETSIIFSFIQKYSDEYQQKPSLKEVGLSIKNSPDLSHSLKESSIKKFKEIAQDEQITNIEFLLDKTEKWVQKIRLTDSVLKAADIIKSEKEFEPIIGMFEEALRVSFDKDLGMQYNGSLENRMEYYKRKIKGISSGIPSVDKALGGGFMDKTLNLIASVSHGGKSALMVSMAANMVINSKKVLYISLEMSEHEIAKRIDANILNININELNYIDNSVIENSFNRIKNNLGELIIKEYPAGSFSVLELLALLDDLARQEFFPEVIFIDYIGLMKSSRISLSKAGGTYGYVKAIAEECHSTAKRLNKPIISAAQLNRGAYGNADAGLESVSESIGLVQTADTFMFLINSAQMKENNQVMLKFEKNRNTGVLNSIMLATDFEHMRYSDYDEGDGPIVPSVSSFGNGFSLDSDMDFGKLQF